MVLPLDESDQPPAIEARHEDALEGAEIGRGTAAARLVGVAPNSLRPDPRGREFLRSFAPAERIDALAGVAERPGRLVDRIAAGQPRDELALVVRAPAVAAGAGRDGGELQKLHRRVWSIRGWL